MITTSKLPTFLAVFALTAFITEAAFSHPLPQESSKVATVDVPACYMQTANGTILSLSKLCKKQPVDLAPTFPSPYDAAAIEKFDQELYGEGN